MQVTFWRYIRSNGDGSCSVKYFKTKAAAQKFASYDDERFCDDVEIQTLDFDSDGNLTTPDPIVADWRLQQGPVTDENY